jgi:hypothetical protein
MRPGLMSEQVRPRPDHRDERHDQLLADRIDRRVGDLREVLLEIVIEQLWPRRQRRDRGVGAHRADRIVGLARHRLEKELQVFLGISEGLLLAELVGRIVRARWPPALLEIGQFGELELGRRQPGFVGMGGRQFALYLLVADDAALFEVDQQHLAGLQAPFAADPVLRNRQHARLGGHDHMVVVGDDKTRRPQAVAIEGRADLATVGEGDGRRPVPRFHQRRVIFVEGAALGIHQRIAGPGFRDQHHHRMRQRIAARHQQFERVVETGGVGLPGLDQRRQFCEVGAEQRRRHRPAPGVHPVDVAAQGIDLAVMGDEAVGMGKPPGRKGVGREALMDERQRRDGQRVGQIAVEAFDLRRQQKTLVDERARREGRHIGVAQGRQAVAPGELGDAVQGLLADHQDLALERILVADARAHCHDRLADRRHRRDDAGAEPGHVGRHLAPADKALALGGDPVLDMGGGDAARLLFPRQKAHRNRVMPGRRQVEPGIFRPLPEQRIGDLDQDAGAVADERIGADGAAMVEIDEDFEAAADQIVRLPALDVDDKADAARIVLVPRIVQALLFGHIHRQCSPPSGILSVNAPHSAQTR